MNAAALEVVKQFTDVVVAYGQSDEFRWVVFIPFVLSVARLQHVFSIRA